MEKKNEIENIINKFVYKFNKNNKYGDEWDHFQEQVKYKNESNKWVGKSFLEWNYYQNKWSTQKCVVYKHERSWTIWLSVWKPYVT